MQVNNSWPALGFLSLGLGIVGAAISSGGTSSPNPPINPGKPAIRSRSISGSQSYPFAAEKIEPRPFGEQSPSQTANSPTSSIPASTLVTNAYQQIVVGQPIPLPELPKATNLLTARHLKVAGWQIYLDGHGISPGPIDGVDGPQTRAALASAQKKLGVDIAKYWESDPRPLQSRPQFLTYSITIHDLARLQPLGTTWWEKSQQSRLDYESVLELVAEMFHSSQPFIRLLNPQSQWDRLAAGDIVTVPNVQPALLTGKAAVLRIKIGEKNLQAFDVQSNLLVHFPCSIAQRLEKRPLGQLEIAKVAEQPTYLFNPENFPESEEGQRLGRRLTLPPGPNSPVGTVWIGLNRQGYGIHGTPRPEAVGRTESHGCFRLANWNAELLLKLVSLGTPVLVEP